jgi:hypothetical protein
MAEDRIRPLVGEGTLEYEWMTWPEIRAATDLPVVDRIVDYVVGIIDAEFPRGGGR